MAGRGGEGTGCAQSGFEVRGCEQYGALRDVVESAVCSRTVGRGSQEGHKRRGVTRVQERALDGRGDHMQAGCVSAHINLT